MCRPGDTSMGLGPPAFPGSLSSTYIIKVGDDLVQEPQAFQTLLVDIGFRVELFEIRNGGKHDTDAVIRLVV